MEKTLPYINCFRIGSRGNGAEESLAYDGSFTFVIVTEGTAVFTQNNKCYRAGRNSIVHFTPHRYMSLDEASDDFEAMCLSCNQQFISELPYIREFYVFMFSNQLYDAPVLTLDAADVDVLLGLLQRMDVYVRADKSVMTYSVQLIHAYAEVFEFELLTAMERNGMVNAVLNNHAKDICRAFMELLFANFTRQHTVAFYASRLNLTTQYLTLVVKQATGRTVAELIGDFLYSKACVMLHSSDMSVKQVADRLCFSDQAAFCKFFKKRAGRSPSEFK